MENIKTLTANWFAIVLYSVKFWIQVRKYVWNSIYNVWKICWLCISGCYFGRWGNILEAHGKTEKRNEFAILKLCNTNCVVMTSLFRFKKFKETTSEEIFIFILSLNPGDFQLYYRGNQWSDCHSSFSSVASGKLETHRFFRRIGHLTFHIDWPMLLHAKGGIENISVGLIAFFQFGCLTLIEFLCHRLSLILGKLLIFPRNLNLCLHLWCESVNSQVVMVKFSPMSIILCVTREVFLVCREIFRRRMVLSIALLGSQCIFWPNYEDR